MAPLWCFDGEAGDPAAQGSESAGAFAAGVVAAILPALTPAPDCGLPHDA